MEKENKRLKLLSIILLVIVVIFGSYIVYDKLMGEGTDTEKVDENVEKDFDLDAAEQLLSIYSGILSYRSAEGRRETDETCNSCVEGAEDAYKAWIAYEYTQHTKVKTLSSSAWGDECKNIANESVCYASDVEATVQYDDINATYKYLFGSNSSLEKKRYMYARGLGYLAYIETKDYFVEAHPNMSGMPWPWEYKVISAKVSGDELKVKVAYAMILEHTLDDFKSPYTDNTYKWTEKQNFIDEELQYFDEYNFIFENENGHYIFKDVVKA